MADFERKSAIPGSRNGRYANLGDSSTSRPAKAGASQPSPLPFARRPVATGVISEVKAGAGPDLA